MAVPVNVISGFLGAGKTSAIRAQLGARAGERIAIIVNDFGEAGLDEATLSADEPFRVTNIPGGCVCCTAPEGFVGALGAVLAAGPDRLIIEPTGLARPQDLIDTIRRSPHRDALEIAPVIVMVDPRNLELGKLEELPLMREQVEGADVVVANHTDACDPADLERFEAWVTQLWPEPMAIHRTTYGQLEPTVLDWPEGEGARAPREVGDAHDHGRDSTKGFSARSWRWSPQLIFSRERLLAALGRLAAGEAGAPVARLKGIFRTQEGVFRLEIAGGEVHDALTSYRRDSRADLILRGADDAALERAEEWLTDALLREDELQLDTERIEIVLPDGRVREADRELLTGLPEQVDDIAALFPKREGRAARVERIWSALDLPASGHVVVVAGDGFATEPVAIDVLRQGFVLHSLGDEALPAKQGGPFRLLIPEEADAPLGACANVKGLAKFVVRGG
jgi:G3E family GTPase